MKLRNCRKREYIFFPSDESSLGKRSYVFKSKTKLYNFLNGRIADSINGLVRVYENYLSSCYWIADYDVYYNYKQYNSGAKLRINLSLFDKNKYRKRLSKEDKKYFAFSNRRIELMSKIQDDINNNRGIDKSNAKNLVKVFYKSGFKDFDLETSENKEYILYNIENGIPFSYWSDRCGYVRMKAIIEYFKLNNIILL